MNPADLGRALQRPHQLTKALCPRCQKDISVCTSIGHTSAPSPGDLSVCSPCGAVLEFQPNLSFRLMSDSEIVALPDETLLALLDGIEAAVILERARAAITASKPKAPRSSRARRA